MTVISEEAGRIERPRKGNLFGSLYFQVLIGVAAGIAVGWLFPSVAVPLKSLGDFFIRCVKMLLVPIVFATIAVGIARMTDIKELGRVGIKTILYFELASTAALIIGMIVGNVFAPGAGLNVDPATIDTKSIAGFSKPATSFFDSIFHLVPDNIVRAFSNGDILPVLVFAVLFGIGLSLHRKATQQAVDALDGVLSALFGVMAMVMWLAPIGAFGAMAFTVGKYGLGSLLSLAKLVACVYGTSILFVLVVLGGIAKLCKIQILPFLRFIRAEIAVVLGTCSSESVLPQLIEKLERCGCPKPIVGLVMPAGITFNPDGSAIYLSLAVIFIAQATNTPLDLVQQLGLLAVLLLTSKGSAGVAGAAFIALAATLSTTNAIPVAGLALLLGVDRFMNEARAVTNTIGNALATVAISVWEGGFDRQAYERALADDRQL